MPCGRSATAESLGRPPSHPMSTRGVGEWDGQPESDARRDYPAARRSARCGDRQRQSTRALRGHPRTVWHGYTSTRDTSYAVPVPGTGNSKPRPLNRWGALLADDTSLPLTTRESRTRSGAWPDPCTSRFGGSQGVPKMGLFGIRRGPRKGSYSRGYWALQEYPPPW